MGQMKRFGMWLAENKRHDTEVLVQMAMTAWDLEDSAWLRRQIAYVKGENFVEPDEPEVEQIPNF